MTDVADRKALLLGGDDVAIVTAPIVASHVAVLG